MLFYGQAKVVNEDMFEYLKLLKRLSLGFFLLTFIVFMVVMDIMRYHLAQQQEVALQHDMDRLELVLNAYWDQPEKVDLDVLLQSWLKKNHDVKMTVYFNNKDPSISWQSPPLPSHVPNWFMSFKWFEPVKITKNTQYHWQQRAMIELVGETALVYHDLWFFFQQTAFTFTLFVLIGMMLISLVLKQALRPLEFIAKRLKQVTVLRSAFANSQKTSGDLNSITENVAFLTSHVEEMHALQVLEAKKWRYIAYLDPVTQLGNRTYFLKQVDSWIETGGQGGAIILRLKSLSKMEEVYGFNTVALQLKSLSWQLQNCHGPANSILARISEEEFVLVLQDMEESLVLEKVAGLAQQLPLLCPDPIGNTRLNVQIGVIYQHSCDAVESFLLRLDQVLAQANYESEKPYSYLADTQLPPAMGKCAWKELVHSAIAEQSLRYRFQSVEMVSGEVLHQEIFSYLIHEAQEIRAYRYMHALETLKVIDIIDKYMLETAAKYIRTQSSAYPVAINISAHSINKPAFINWLGDFLATHADIISKLHFELPESFFMYGKQQAQQFCRLIRQAGAGLGIDQYGKYFQNLDYIKLYKPDYVKLDPTFTHKVTEISEQVVLTSIARIAKQQGILAIATRVETQAQVDRLAEYFIDGFQGHIFQVR